MKKAQCGECGRAGGYALYCLRCAEEMLKQQEPVGKFAKFTDGIWREVTDGSAGVPLYAAPQQTEQSKLERNYMELIMSVGNAYPNETRHQTALRYIKEREVLSTDQAKLNEKNK